MKIPVEYEILKKYLPEDELSVLIDDIPVWFLEDFMKDLSPESQKEITKLLECWVDFNKEYEEHEKCIESDRK